VTPVLKGRRKRPSTSTAATATVRAPSRAAVLLRLPRGAGASAAAPCATIAVVLQGERCLRCQPALRPGRRYHFPLLRPADPAGNPDDRADYWGDGTGHDDDATAAVAATPRPQVLVAVLPPVEIQEEAAEAQKGFATRPGLFAYPDHRPYEGGGVDSFGEGESSSPPAASSCCLLQARVVHFEGVIRGVCPVYVSFCVCVCV
jgi:hypothetical protein